jgi:hypothetical protein
MNLLRLSLAALTIGLLTGGPAQAAYTIIRWPSGDCTIWDNVGLFAIPGGRGWAPIAVGIPTYPQAKGVLEAMYRRGLLLIRFSGTIVPS